MTPFDETPQAKGLRRQMDATPSNWKRYSLVLVYLQAKDFYEKHNGVPPGQQHDDLQSTEKEIAMSMSIEQLIAANTAAIEALTATIAGAKVGTASAGSSEAKEDAPAKGKPGPKPGVKANATSKPKYTREQMVAVLTEVSEKHGKEAARALFSEHAEKMKDIPDENIEAIYLLAKEKAAEEPDTDDDM